MKNYSLFILDNDQEQVETMSSSIREYEILSLLPIKCFDSPNDMLDNIDEKSPTILIIDYFLKGIVTSPEVITLVRKINKSSLIIGISHTSDLEKTIEMLEAGANNFISKEYILQLPRLIENHLDVRKQLELR